MQTVILGATRLEMTPAERAKCVWLPCSDRLFLHGSGPIALPASWNAGYRSAPRDDGRWP
jgi:hypothetical protein